MIEVLLKHQGQPLDLTPYLMSVSPLRRRTEEEGRRPSVLYFDNLDIEVPLVHTDGLFDLEALNLYPDYRLDIRIFNETVFTGFVDITSITFTDAQTVRFSAYALLSRLDRLRWPPAWEVFELVGEWDQVGSADTVEVQILPMERVGDSDFFEYIYVQPLPVWKASIPLRTGDYFQHPEHDSFTYQVREKSVVTTDNAQWHKIVPDRPWFQPGYGSGAGPIYGSVYCKKRELLGVDMYLLFAPQYPTTIIHTDFAAAILGKVGIDYDDLDLDFFENEYIHPDFGPLLARMEHPVDVLFKVLAARGYYLYIDRAGKVQTRRIDQIASLSDPVNPGGPATLDDSTIIDYSIDFDWDKRVDTVKVNAQWRGETHQHRIGIKPEGTATRLNELSIDTIGNAARAEQIAQHMYNLYHPRRLEAHILLPAGALVSGSDKVFTLDLFHLVRWRQIDWWIGGLDLNLSDLSVKLQLYSIEGFDPDTGAEPESWSTG